jgi:proliferating cell nuclear antigen
LKATCILPVKDLKTLLKGLNVLVYEARWHFTNKGLKVRAVDAANVAMVIATIEPDAFHAYKITEEDVVIGVELDNLYEMCKSFDSKEHVDITVMDGKLSVTSGSITYTTAIIDPSAIRREPKLPELDLSAEVVIDAKEFKRAIAAVDRVSDVAFFEKTDVGFRILGEGDIESIAYSVDNSGLIDCNNGKAKAKFGINYLKEFCKVTDGRLRIRFDNNYPCWLTFEIKDGFTLEYILAPRVEE